MNAKKIIVPTDFSHSSDGALEFATALAKQSGGILVIVHIEEPMGNYEGEMYYGPLNPNRAALQKMLNDVQPTDPSVACEHRLLASGATPATTIIACATEENADLIVMSTHGRTGFKRLLLGSVAEVVVRRAPCPVLIVKPHAAKATPATS
jgi:universal stress protein A